MATAHHQSAEHEFKRTWRWPEQFEAWAESLITDANGPVANIFAGLSPLGDIRVDLNTPTELVTSLQADSGTNLERARTYLQDHINGIPPVDVISSLACSASSMAASRSASAVAARLSAAICSSRGLVRSGTKILPRTIPKIPSP